jgi:hypothetical protein
MAGQANKLTSPKTLSAGSDRHQYPQELGSLSQPHAVQFFIQARSTSKAATESRSANAGSARMQEQQDNFDKDYTKENRAKGEEAKAAAAGAGLLAGAIGVAAASSKIFSKDASALGQAGISAGIAIAAGGAQALLTTNTSLVRLLASIQLYVPASIMTSYSANWEEAQLGIAGTLGSGRLNMTDAAELPEYIGRGMIGAAANLPKELGGSGDFASLIESTSKKVNNPYKEQLFKSMGFRKFSFNYAFAPRNKNELAEVQAIISLFKYHMHPEASKGELFLVYPSEFSIEFHSLIDGIMAINPELPKVSSCVLTSAKVTYGPDGNFNTFIDTGAATEYGLELQFTELETLTANRIEDGL